jgi:NAD(P)-dependent dehydrogenase (short-subunit alcohol dehydrogenase family)
MTETQSSGRVWFITGASSGFGRAIAEAAVAAGDSVVATARRLETLEDLCRATPDRVRALRLDVTELATLPNAVEEAIAQFGRIDVLVNNAGRGYVGAIEEANYDELHAAMTLHLYGPAVLVRAVLPHMRARRTGAIVQISTLAGRVSYPGVGVTSASKFALEGLSDALAAEVAPLGLTVLIVEPGSFRTNAGSPTSYYRVRDRIADYEATAGAVGDLFTGSHGDEPGDPVKGAAAILHALDAETTPLRLLIGSDAFDLALYGLDQTKESALAWETVSRSTAFTDAPNEHTEPPSGLSWATTTVTGTDSVQSQRDGR